MEARKRKKWVSNLGHSFQTVCEVVFRKRLFQTVVEK